MSNDIVYRTLNMIESFPQDWISDSVVLLGPTGSHAYGTATKDSDDDVKGIVIPPISYHLGLDSFSEYNNTGGKNYKNTKDDLDLSLLHLNKFVKDAMAGVPNNIEMLFLPINNYFLLTYEGEQLIKHRHLFLSKQIMKKFGGFAKSQMIKMKEKNSNGAARQDLVNAFGYDTKFFYNAVRLLKSAIEILNTGDYSTHRGDDIPLLMDCRNGLYTFYEAIRILEQLDEQLKVAYENTKLPDEPDRKLVNDLLIELNSSFLSLRQC